MDTTRKRIVVAIACLLALLGIVSAVVTTNINQYYGQKRALVQIENSEFMRTFSDLSWRIGERASVAPVTSSTGYRYQSMEHLSDPVAVSFDWRNSRGERQHLQAILRGVSTYDGVQFVLLDNAVSIYGQAYSALGTQVVLITTMSAKTLSSMTVAP